MSGRLRALTVRLPEPYLESLEELVRSGLYVSVSEAIRMAVRDMIAREGHLGEVQGEVTSPLMVEEVEGALNGVLERLREEGLIAAVLRAGNAPVFPRAYVMLRNVEISSRSIGGSATRSSQEYELVFEGLGADPLEQYNKVLRAALRAYALIREDPTLGVSGADVLASPVELRRTDYVDQGKRAVVLSMTVRVSVESSR